jgi:hypothetical protein
MPCHVIKRATLDKHFTSRNCFSATLHGILRKYGLQRLKSGPNSNRLNTLRAKYRVGSTLKQNPTSSHAILSRELVCKIAPKQLTIDGRLDIVRRFREYPERVVL